MSTRRRIRLRIRLRVSARVPAAAIWGYGRAAMEMDKRTVRFSDATWRALESRARSEGMSAAQLVREAVAAHLAALGERGRVAELDARTRDELREIRERLERVEEVTGARR